MSAGAPKQVVERLCLAERCIAELEAQVKDLANRVDGARRIAIRAESTAVSRTDPRHFHTEGAGGR